MLGAERGPAARRVDQALRSRPEIARVAGAGVQKTAGEFEILELPGQPHQLFTELIPQDAHRILVVSITDQLQPVGEIGHGPQLCLRRHADRDTPQHRRACMEGACISQPLGSGKEPPGGTGGSALAAGSIPSARAAATSRQTLSGEAAERCLPNQIMPA